MKQQVKNIFVIIGTDQLLIKQKIIHILKEHNIQTVCLIKLKINENSLEEIVSEISYCSLFKTKIICLDINQWNKLKQEDKKIILKTVQKSKNWIFLCSKTQLSINWQKELGDSVQLVKITKTIKKSKKELIIEKLQTKKIYVQPETIDYLMKNLPDNLMIVEQEIEKITNYAPIHSGILDKSICQKIINKYKSGKIFALIAGLLEGNKVKVVNSYWNLTEKDEIKPLVLLATLQTYLFFIKKIQVLLKTKQTLQKIAQKLKKSPFFVFHLVQIIRKSSNEKLSMLIKKMYNLEYELKTTKLADSKLLLELFLIS